MLPDWASTAKAPFSHYLMKQSIKLRQWSLLIALILYGLFAVLDCIKFPVQMASITIPVRLLFIVLPLAALNYIFWFRVPNSISDFKNSLLLVYFFGGCIHSLIYALAVSHNLVFSQLGLVLILMFGCLLTALPIKPAGGVTVVILAIFSVTNLFLDRMSLDMVIAILIIASVAVLLLLINHACQRVLRENFQLIKQLYRDTIRDSLTQLYNKRFFDTQLDNLLLLMGREHIPVSLVLVDVDHFKRINDKHGHRVGDHVLGCIATTLQSYCRRPNDYAFRIGGDEFAILFYGISKEKLISVCEEMRSKVMEISLDDDSNTAESPQVSIGACVTEKTSHYTSAELFEAADNALYKAKAQGRNICLIESA